MKWYNFIKRIISHPDVRVFVIFSLISSLIWLIERMRQNYSTGAYLTIELSNIPQEYVLGKPDSADTVRIQLNGTGFDLLVFAVNKEPIHADIQRLTQINRNGTTFAVIPPKLIETEVLNILPSNLQLKHIYSDTVYIPLLKTVKRLLPVKLQNTPKLQPQHMFSAETKLQPCSVYVWGTNNIMDTIAAIYLKNHDNLQINDTISLTLPFDNIANIKPQIDLATVTYFVEPYTQKIIKLPITAINIPDGYSFRPFPHEVEVRFSVGVSHLQTAGYNDISVIADISEVQLNSKSRQMIKLKMNSDAPYIFNISYEPMMIDFVLEKLK